MAPQTAELTGRAVVTLSGGGVPGARPAHTAANFNDVGSVGIDAGHPVETVSAQVGEATALGKELFQRVQHLGGPVFGVRASNQDFVVGKEAGAFVVEVFVGGDVVGEVLLFEPVNQVEVGAQIARAVCQDLAVVGTHVDERAQA